MQGILRAENRTSGMEESTAMRSDSVSVAQRAAHDIGGSDLETAVAQQFLNFDPISLEQTNAQAQMLSRFDNKYVVDFDQLQVFLRAVKHEFAVLEIKGTRQFTYSSCYYDDHFGCYYDHHQDRRRRFKVRTREYVDSGDKYFEIKLKGLRGRTSKHRTSSDYLVTPKIEGEHLDTLCEMHLQQYKMDMPYDLRPALMVGYKRTTLVALRGGERVTIDYYLSFSVPGERGEPVRVGNGFIIVETKSGDGKGIADSALKRLGIRQASKCSKYCIGVNLTASVTKNNNFRATLNRVRRNIVPDNLGPQARIHSKPDNAQIETWSVR